MKNVIALSAALTLGLAACGGGADDAAEEETPPSAATAGTMSVTILEPTDGATVTGPVVNVRLAAAGVPIVPAGDLTPNTGHHHLYLDVDFPATEAMIPAGAPGIIHLGQAQKDYHWESVTPGPHRIIAVLADPGHIPLRPYVTDTVNFVVAAPAATDTATKK